jgi:hypothetical protein
MTRVCPQPSTWNEVYKRLLQVAASRPDLREVPVPLILAGWAWSNDLEKMDRWEMTVQWAKEAGCEEIVTAIADGDFRFVHVPTDYEVGPSGGPMYRPWDFERKDRPEESVLTAALAKLSIEWPAIAAGFAVDTRPLCFSGDKARNLAVTILLNASPPPWGNWHKRSNVEAERRTFTNFRRAVNKAIYPHEVDHIEFVPLPPQAPKA